MILIEFFLSVILAELVSVAIAISYIFLFKKGLNNVRAQELFGKKGAVALALFFTAINYPYICEAIVYINQNEASIYMLIAFVFTLLFGSMRHIKSLGALVKKRNEDPDAVSKELEKAFDKSQPMDLDTKVILITLGLWFFGIGAIWAIYVHNA